MHHRYVVVMAALFALSASAQDMGLDLSEAKTPAEFQPSIAFIGVTPAEVDPALTGRAKLLESELTAALVATEQFSSVKKPADVAQVSADARKCTDFACLEALAEKLGVNRIVSATVAKQGIGTVLVVHGFDPTLPAVLPASVESAEKNEKAAMGGFSGLAGKSQVQRDKDFVAKAKPVFIELVKALQTPLGKLEIDVIEQKAVTRIRGKEVGTGSFDKTMPAANYEIEVSSDEYLPFTTTVSVEPQKTVTVKVTLIAKAVERAPVPPPAVDTSTPVYKRPGLYLGAAGIILMAVGFGLGANAKSLEGRAVDANHDGYVDITRAQAGVARTDALLANIFVTVGAVALAGGVIWAFVVPLFSKRPAAAPPASGGSAPSDDTSGGGFGFTSGLGGTF